ncbi:phage tail protein [Leptolyngbyaceae cyanobacterium CCMR0082]|uniref:Phage tail protein n=2 Tax=Adonisia turfae TaxID=2950184 RepID=A0A6M0SFM1_9CYAN|nr:phage tail protein [Adonisia turfae]MDV3348639.1 phage tail protein [Leptothoe sp. LEGE 181152]NEZ57617.1 phage tail protein [Adonisia turfae CCMR0081]NEZ67309.1 phage tail protein [Adonisia turfae CCMR0082]
MGELVKPIAPSSFYLELAGVCEGEKSVFKSVTLPDYTPKVQGGQQAVGTTKGGKTIWQVNSAGFEGLFTLDCVTIASGDGDSTSKKLYEWFEKCLPSSNGGKSKWTDNKVEGSITAYNTDGEEIAQWQFTEAWPSKYKCADLDVTADAYIEETYTITCEKFNRTK